MPETKEEKIFTIPLRDVFEKPRTKRAKLAVNFVRNFLKRHMKSENVKIGASINKVVWSRGIQKPPRRVKVHALKTEAGIYVELVGVDIKPPTEAEIKKKAEKLAEKEKKLKEARKERKKMTLEKEVQEEKKEAERTREEIKAEKTEEARPESAEIKAESKEEKKEEKEKIKTEVESAEIKAESKEEKKEEKKTERD